MSNAINVAKTDYRKALMGSAYDTMFFGLKPRGCVFAQYFGTPDYYYDLAMTSKLIVILDKVRVVDTIAMNIGNPYVTLPEIFKEFTLCRSMDDFKKALECQKTGIIAYGTNEADEDTDDEDENDDSSKKKKKEKFVERLVKIMKEVKSMFDYVVTNPPYCGSLHLDFFELGLNHLKSVDNNKTGQMTIIEPSTWLVNLRKYDKKGRYGKNVRKKDYDTVQRIKKTIEGHVKKIVLENLNREFSIGNYTPLSITYVDFSQTYDTIDFECCGEVKKVKSLNDCNLIGSYDTIWSILNKVLAHGDMMDNHTTTVEKDGMWYLPYREILTYNGWDSEVDYVPTKNGIYYGIYTTPCCHKDRNDVRDFIGTTKKRIKKDGSKYGGNPEPSVYGTKQELENWKHFIFNNKLPLFINIVLTIDQNNNSKEFLPWLVDKQYTDEEIYAKFNLTKDEIALIDATLKKFERNSPWFKRYMCGVDPDATTKSIEADVADIVKGAQV